MLTENIWIYVLVFVYGIVIGSFLNVCIYRIPKRESVVVVRSHCMSCGNQLRWYDLVPVFSWLSLGGKCRYCKRKISAQYPLIEVMNGVAYFLIVWVNGVTVTSLLYCLCVSALLALSVIDWRTYEIPPVFPFVIGCLGGIRILTDLAHWSNYVIGFFSISLFLYVLYISTRGRGIGGGDIKLMAATGLLMGWKLNFFGFFMGCVLGSVIHVALMKWKEKDKVLAFGPYLSMGIFLAMLVGDRVVNWYLSLL